jgi:hypothetical protein
MEELQCAACLRKTTYLLAKKIGKYFFCEKCFPTNAANTTPNNQPIKCVDLIGF